MPWITGIVAKSQWISKVKWVSYCYLLCRYCFEPPKLPSFPLGRTVCRMPLCTECDLGSGSTWVNSRERCIWDRCKTPRAALTSHPCRRSHTNPWSNWKKVSWWCKKDSVEKGISEVNRSIFLKMRLYSKSVLIYDIAVVVREFFTLHFSNISLSRSMLGLYLSSFFAAASLHLMHQVWSLSQFYVQNIWS